MNARSQTAHDLAAALLGTPRRSQTVTRISSLHGGDRPARHVVLVTPDGSETGEYFEVSDRTRELLESGRTPEWLQLEAYVPSEADEDDFEAEFDRRYAERNAL